MRTFSEPAAADWHTLTPHEALERLSSGLAGLNDAEARTRLEAVGPNRLKPPQPVPAIRILVDQFKSVVVYLLIAAAVVSLILDDRIEAAAIGVVLVINTVIGFLTELRARRAMEGLLQFDVAHATVMRGGQLTSVDAATIVPGDVVRIESGHRVPADARLIESVDLRTDEAALTGESLPVSKDAAIQLDAGTMLADRRNVVYKGTTVAAGTGLAVVVQTGPSTEIGRIGALVGTIEERRTPLEERLDELGRRLVWLALGVALLVAVMGALQGAPLGLVVQMGIALAVAAVPESLPAVATIALAVGVHRMATRHALVRRLPVVETLGSATVVCTDKTRTLTSGQMTLVRLWTADHDVELGADVASAEPAVTAALEVALMASRPQPRASDGEAAHGDPVDRALVVAGSQAGLDREALVNGRPLRGMVPFSSDRKFMASFHQVGGDVVAYAKGAPRQILKMSGSVLTGSGARPLDEPARQQLLAMNDAMARDGLRVLSLASGPVARAEASALENLTFVGFVGLADPPAPGVREAIGVLRSAGLRTVMLTGDQRATALAVGRQLNLLADGHAIIDGRELDAMAPAELAERLPHIAGFSRITPEHKLRLVEALQARGEVVAMLGDGVNDAPALRKADVGVAMGIRGTDVAKEAAAIVLQDDRFETVSVAVEEGRVIFDNIRKFVFYLFSCNIAEVLVFLFAAVAMLPMPLLPLQILWLNMVTDTFPALALALEPRDATVMDRPPRKPDEAILSRQFFRSVFSYALLITVSTLAALALFREGSVEQGRTAAFMTLAFAQIFHLGNARSDQAVTGKRTVSNPYALGALVVSVLLQVAAVYLPPLAMVLGVTTPAARDWLVIIGLALVPAVIGQAVRIWRR